MAVSTSTSNSKPTIPSRPSYSCSYFFLGVLTTFSLLATCYINGDQSQLENIANVQKSPEEFHKSHSINNIASEQRDYERAANGSLPLSSRLANKYFPSSDHYNSIGINQNSQNLQPLNDTVSYNDVRVDQDENQLQLQTNELDPAAVYSSNTNMLHVLEYERLKRFLRRLSSTTIRKLRKLLMWNPEEGQRYLVQLARNANEDQLRGRTKSSAAISEYLDEFGNINHKDLVKIATVIFEPEFLEFAEVDKFQHDTQQPVRKNLGNRPNANKPSETETTNHRVPSDQNVPPMFETFDGKNFAQSPLPPRQKTPKPSFNPPNGYYDRKKPNIKTSLKAKIRNGYRKLRPRLNPFQLDSHKGRPSSYLRPKQVGNAPSQISGPHMAAGSKYPSRFKMSSSFQSSNKAHVGFGKRQKPMVEFIQIVNPFNKKQNNLELVTASEIQVSEQDRNNSGSSSTETERHPVSFYISSILADTDKKLQQYQGYPEELVAGSEYQDYWVHDSDNEGSEDLDHDSSGFDSSQASSTTGDLLNEPSVSIKEVTHHELPLLPGITLSHTKSTLKSDSISTSSGDNWVSSPITISEPGTISSGFKKNSGVVIDESPYNNAYNNIPGNHGTGITTNYPNTYGNFIPSTSYGHGAQGSGGTLSGHGFGNGQVTGHYQLPLEYYYGNQGSTIGIGHNNGLQLHNAVGSVHNGGNTGITSYYDNLNGWYNSAKSVFDSIGSGYYSNSAGTRKILEITISILAFLAFGSYIATLLLRAIAPSLLFPLLPGLSNVPRNRTDGLGLLFGRNIGHEFKEAPFFLRGFDKFDNSSNLITITNFESDIKSGIENIIRGLDMTTGR